MPIETAFSGSLARDAEAKTSRNDKQYLRLSVRVENGDKPLYVSVTSFSQDAIDSAARFVKGARVYCEGKLTLDSYTGADGAQRHSLSAIASHLRIAQIGQGRP